MKLIVLVPTFRRPDLLVLALESLRVQTCPDFQIVVTDNDAADQAGRVAAMRWAEEHGHTHSLNAILCTDRGLSQNRNHGLAYAFGTLNADAVAMLDDDSEADARWVAGLHQALDEGAELIGGPTIYRFPDDASQLIRRLDMFKVPYHENGVIPRLRSANNCTILRSIYERAGGAVFDTNFGKTGGEDTQLFIREQQRGTVSWWQNDAVVYESVPEARCNIEWVADRHKTSAINAARIDVTINGAQAAWPRQLLIAGREFLAGVAHFLKGSGMWTARERITGATGRVQGLLGKRNSHDSWN